MREIVGKLLKSLIAPVIVVSFLKPEPVSFSLLYPLTFLGLNLNKHRSNITNDHEDDSLLRLGPSAKSET